MTDATRAMIAARACGAECSTLAHRQSRDRSVATWLIFFVTLMLAVLVAPTPVLAQSATDDQGLWQQSTLTGDWRGARKNLQDQGFQLGLGYIAEMLSNPTGGVGQGTIYEGLVTGTVELDLEKLLKWPAATFHVDGYQINGRGLSQNYVGNILAVSGIEALPSTRLHDLWVQQLAFDQKVSLRVGQIGMDDPNEFYNSQYAGLFINSTFGYPDLLAEDLPGGGPGFPFAVPGVRLRINPTDRFTLSAAVFNGTPAPPGPGNPQLRNANGTNFLIGVGGMLAIAELVYSFDKESTTSTWLSDVKLGGWYHSAAFPDLHVDTIGLSLANPNSNGIPALHQANYGPYLILDKMLWQPPNGGVRGVAAFLRVGGALGDRNLLNLEIDTGLNAKGLLPGRPLDVAGIALGYVRIGGAARAFAADANLFTGGAAPAVDYEAVVELTYQVNIAPWWYLQPDLQVILHPGGHAAQPPPSPAGQPIPNALVVGLRSAITF
ncbi:MAG TPA: carbohydrate porin [Stellaceae bacterium]|nr:carbohydrate porin [Stellaceae bacterium]